jgi:hypothetical protein
LNGLYCIYPQCSLQDCVWSHAARTPLHNNAHHHHARRHQRAHNQSRARLTTHDSRRRRYVMMWCAGRAARGRRRAHERHCELLSARCAYMACPSAHEYADALARTHTHTCASKLITRVRTCDVTCIHSFDSSVVMATLVRTHHALTTLVCSSCDVVDVLVLLAR